MKDLNQTIDTCHSLGVPVIFTQHGHQVGCPG